MMIFSLQAQVAINEDGTEPHESAILELKSTDKGLLIPRLSDDEMMGIGDPAEGLLVYNKDKQAFFYYDGTEWILASADNLGNHKATENLQMQGHWISNDGDDDGIFIASDEKVGIGRDDPKNPLDVDGDIRHGDELKFDDGIKENGRIWARFNTADNDVNMFLGAGNINVVAGGDAANLLRDEMEDISEDEKLYLVADPTDDDVAIKFITGLDDDGSERVEAVNILGNGKVGIGTDTPTGMLHIKGDDADLDLDINSDSSPTKVEVRFKVDGDQQAKMYYKKDTHNFVFEQLAGGQIRFNVDFVPAMIIENNRNVGIGTYHAERKLHLNGAMRFEPLDEAPSDPQEGDLYYDANDHCLKYYNGTDWIDIGCETDNTN